MFLFSGLVETISGEQKAIKEIHWSKRLDYTDDQLEGYSKQLLISSMVGMEVF
jgi:hypothetical protein